MATICCATSRPCLAIQMLCQPSMMTAIDNMPALKTSWPLPEKASDKAPAKIATKPAPSTPAPMPPAIQAPRPAMPRVAASTMPTIRPASRTSRKTINSAASIGLLRPGLLDRGQNAQGRRRVVIVEELVGAGLQWPDHHRDLTARRHELLDPQVMALEFGRSRVLVPDVDSQP